MFQMKKEAFSVLGKEGSTQQGPGFIQALWEDANGHFAQIAHLAKRDGQGNLLGVWGAMTDMSRSFLPWEENFQKGLYLAGVECVDTAQPPAGWTKWTIPGFEYRVVEQGPGAFAQALAALEQMVTDCGGYIESRSEQGGSLYSSRYNARYASITARIPADKLEVAMGMAGELCNVVSRSTDVADVTESYADTEARLKTLRLQEERLLEILSKATELSDVLELESRLSDVRYQIESYEATLRSYDSRVSYSTLHITLQEVVEYSIINDPPQTLGQRLSDGFKDSMRMVKNSAENALVWLVTYLPLVLLWAVILAVVVWLVLRLVRRAQKAGKLPKVSRKGKPQAEAPAAHAVEEKKNS